MPIDDQELRAIEFLTLRVRKATPGAGPWDQHGLWTNLLKLKNRNLHMTIEHILRHAADPKAKNPGVIASSFTPAAPVESTRPVPLTRENQCTRCGGYKGTCPCTQEDRAARDEDEPEHVAPMPRDQALDLARSLMRGDHS